MNDLISRREAIEWCLEGLNNMPSAQPEIIRCKDCVYYDPSDNDEESDWCHVWGDTTEGNAFCSYAERKGEQP